MKLMNNSNHLANGILAGFLIALLLGPVRVCAADKDAEAAYEAAAGLFNLGLWKEAADGYKEYFQKHPRHSLAGHAHYGLGLCYFNMKNYAGAAAELGKAASSKGPSKVDANLYLGQALMMKAPANPKGAETAFDESLKAMGMEKEGLLNRTWTKEKIDVWLEANEKEKEREIASTVFVGLLESTYLQGNWKSVITKTEAFGGLVEGAEVEQRVRVLSGEAHTKVGQFKEAAVAYESAANLKGSDAAEALFRLGLVRLNHLESYEAAAENFSEFSGKYRNDPKQPDAAFNEALCYYHSYYGGKQEHLNQAVKQFAAFAKGNPKHDLAEVAQFYSGKLQHVQENWRGAVTTLEPLLDSENPALGQLIFLLGDSHHQLRDWKKASGYYMDFAKGNERALNADVALHNAGVAFSNLNPPDHENAMAAYELLEEKCADSPHVPSARLKLGIIHYQAGRYDAAKKPLAKIPANHALRPDADYFMAWADLDNKQPANAAKRFGDLAERLAQDDPKHRLVALSRLYQGIGEFEGGDFADAATTLGKFVADFEEHEKLDEAAFNLGLAQMELSRWDDAIKSFGKVPVGSNIHDRALYQAAWSNRLANKPAEAVPFYKSLLDQHANSPLANNVALELAEVEFETGGEEGGQDSVNRLVALLNKKPAPDANLRRLANYRLGIIYFNQKKFSDSAKSFEAMVGDADGNLLISAAWQAGEARRQVAVAAEGAAQEAEYKAALKNYEIAVNAKPGEQQANTSVLQEQAILRIGQSQAALFEWADSQAQFEKFIKDHPRHKLVRTAHLGLGWALQNQEKHVDAIASLEQVVTEGIRDDTGARAQFLLGECYFEQKQYAKCIIEFSKVESLYAFPQWQSKAAYELAQALLRQDQRDKAKMQFQRLIDKYPDTPAATAAKNELRLLN